VKRRAFLVAATGLATLNALGQTVRKPARVGVLSSTNPEARAVFWDAFKEAMVKFGWVEGRNLTYSYRYTHGDPSRLNALAAELVAEKPDLIFTGSTGAAVAVRQATGDIPLVFGYVGDPIGVGLVASLARPGGNATGMSSLGIDLSSKQLELLKEIQPRLRRVVALGTGPAATAELQRAGRVLGIEVELLKAADSEQIDKAFDALQARRPDGLVVSPSGIAMISRSQFTERVAGLRIPAIYGVDQFVVAGGLMSYSTDFVDSFRRAASYADRILKGAKPADLPVEQPRGFDLVVNLKAARAQGIKIPQSVLGRATRVIE
jgi:putative ABC transport system substrate-binding protein